MATVTHEKDAVIVSQVGEDSASLPDILEQTAAWVREHGEGKVIFGQFRIVHPCRWIVDIVLSQHDH